MLKFKKVLLATALLTAMVGFTGCVKPYEQPIFEEIEANETAFLVPMSDSAEQAKFESVEFLESKKVAAKRIQIKQEWVQTGRMANSGYRQPSERVIRVSRTPVTREWTNKSDTGTSSTNQAVEAETKESIPFSANITAVAQIEEPDTATFLYRYQGSPLEDIMDREIKTTIQSEFVVQSAKYTLEEILLHKEDIMTAVKEATIPYFKERGITITTIGMIGSFNYSPDIQKSIDENFKSKKAVETAKNNAEAALEEAKGKVKAMEEQAKYLDQIIKLEEIQVQKDFIEKWDSHLPSNLVTDGGNIMSVLPGATSSK